MSTILIIDDHPAFRMIVRLQLMQLLSVEEVVEADNGQTAVEMARQYKPDLAILDLDIPRISGLDVIPRLKLVHPPIRVMVLSGHDPATFAPRAMRCRSKTSIRPRTSAANFSRPARRRTIAPSSSRRSLPRRSASA